MNSVAVSCRAADETTSPDYDHNYQNLFRESSAIQTNSRNENWVSNQKDRSNYNNCVVI